MLLEVIVGAVLGLVLSLAVVVLVLKRAPVLFVADKLPGNLYGGADDVRDFVDGEIEGEGPGNGGGTRRSGDEADVIDRPGGDSP